MRYSYHRLFVVRGNNAKNRTQHKKDLRHIHTHTCIHWIGLVWNIFQFSTHFYMPSRSPLCETDFCYIYNKCRVCTTSATHEHSTLTGDRHNITLARICFSFFFFVLMLLDDFVVVAAHRSHSTDLNRSFLGRSFCMYESLNLVFFSADVCFVNCVHAFLFFFWFNFDFLLSRLSSSFVRAHFWSTLLMMD